MKSFIMRFPEGRYKAMTFSYDDGLKADLRLAEIMEKYGAKCTFNINTKAYEKTDEPEIQLSLSELKKIASNPNFEIACHGHRHPYYFELPQANVTTDIIKNRLALEEKLGKIVRGFAYPSALGFNEISEAALKAADIVYARTVIGAMSEERLAQRTLNFSLPKNWLRWLPTCHHKNALPLYKKFAEAREIISDPYVMYVWGHAYEFENDNNWELLEELLGLCSNNPDIWLATNMELYEYAQAFKKLVFFADGSKVYNPTNIDLWAAIFKSGMPKKPPLPIVKIPAGETVSLSI